MAATRTACFLRATVQERGSVFAGLRTSSSTISTFLFLKQDFVETISQPFSTRGRLWGALRKANASVVGGTCESTSLRDKLYKTLPACDLASDVFWRGRAEGGALRERSAHVEDFQDVVSKERR